MSTKILNKSSIQANYTKTISDYMQLCMAYDMSFDYDTKRAVMYISYLSLQDEEYTEVYFNSKTEKMERAFISLDADIHEYAPEDQFFKILELIRKDFLKNIYFTYGLVEHPNNRMKRRGTYQDIIELMHFACTNDCIIEYSGNIFRITAAKNENPICQITIAINKGTYQLGMLQKQGITIDIPTIQSMKCILEKLAR